MREKLYLSLASYGLHKQRIFVFRYELLYLKVDTSSFLKTYLSYVPHGKHSLSFVNFFKRVSEKSSQRRQKAHPDYFLYFTQAQSFVVIASVRKNNRPFTVSNDVKKITEYFKLFSPLSEKNAPSPPPTPEG